MSPTFRAKATRFFQGPGAAYLIVLFFLVVGVYYQNREADRRAEKVAIAACKRGKKDRVDNARAFSTMANYYQGVTDAESVQEDVKRIARQARDQLDASAASLKKRILVCGILVRDRKQVPDERVLRLLPSSPHR